MVYKGTPYFLMDDLGGKPHYFLETSIWILVLQLSSLPSRCLWLFSCGARRLEIELKSAVVETFVSGKWNHEAIGGFMISRYKDTYEPTNIPSLKLTSPLKIDPWNRWFLLETIVFRGELLVSGSVMECHNGFDITCLRWRLWICFFLVMFFTDSGFMGLITMLLHHLEE